MAKTLNSRIPEGPVAEKWSNYKAHQRLVNPKNKLKLDVIVVGTVLEIIGLLYGLTWKLTFLTNRNKRFMKQISQWHSKQETS